MRLFRIAPEKFGADLSGTGARLFGGCWTPKGIPAVYTSESPSLAALEVLVHHPLDMAPEPLVLLEIEFPDSLQVEAIDLSRLDKDWRAYPYLESTVKIGDEWAKKKEAVALKVPTAIMPYSKGWNFVLNPICPEFNQIKIIGVEPFTFDNRLL